MKYDLDIIVPVFREEGNISKTLQEISKISEINYRILVIYDFDEDPTLNVINQRFNRSEVICLKNKYEGFNGAIKTGFENIQSKATLLYPADDHKNFNLISKMFNKFNEGYDIVCASDLLMVEVMRGRH